MPVWLKAYIPPPKLIDTSAVTKQVEAAMEEAANVALRHFGQTVQTWDHKPSFERTREWVGDTMAVSVGTDDEIYTYVSQGTKPHIIRPKRAKRLSFQTGYRAKTRRRVLSSSAGGPYGERVTAGIVRHPGTEAREFGEEIAEKMSTAFEKRAAKVFEDVAKDASSKQSTLKG